MAAASPAAARPVSLEYWAFGVMSLVGLAFAGWTIWSGGSPLDQMTVVTAASLVGTAHLLGAASARRRFRRRGAERRPNSGLSARRPSSARALGFYVFRTSANQHAGAVAIDWPTFRGSVSRAGTFDELDRLPERPSLLWTLDLLRSDSGRVFIHSSPTVIDGRLFVGACAN